jgi:hypothetical protein
LGFGLLNCRSEFSVGRFYRVSLPAARPNPNVEEKQGFREFQLPPQEAPSVWSDASEPSSGRWNYGGEMDRPNVYQHKHINSACFLSVAIEETRILFSVSLRII